MQKHGFPVISPCWEPALPLSCVSGRSITYPDLGLSASLRRKFLLLSGQTLGWGRLSIQLVENVTPSEIYEPDFAAKGGNRQNSASAREHWKLKRPLYVCNAWTKSRVPAEVRRARRQKTCNPAVPGSVTMG